MHLPILKISPSDRININERLILKKNLNKLDIQKYDNKLNNFSTSISNILSKSNSINYFNQNKNRNVLLTSVFNLPKLDTNEDINDSFHKINNLIPLQNKNNLKKDNNSKIGINSSLKTQQYISVYKNNKIDNQSLKISSLLKNKFYIDSEKKFAKYNKEKNETKDKIIHIKKVTKFWKNLFDYLNPLFEVEKYELKKKLYKRNNKSSRNIILKENNLISKLSSNSPRIYSNSMLSNLIHNQQKIKKKIFEINQSKNEFDLY